MISSNSNRSHQSTVVIGWFIALGMASTLSIPDGSGIYPTILSIIGLGLLIRRPELRVLVKKTVFCRDYAPITLTAILAVILPLCLEYYHGDDISPDPYIILLLFPSIALAIHHFKVPSFYFFLGSALGCVGALSTAIFQHFYLDIGRAHGYMNAIPFGNISVIFGIISLAGSRLYWNTNRTVALMLFVGAVCGFYASLLSGTKAGWLVMILCTIVLLIGLFKANRFSSVKLTLGLASALLTLWLVLPNHVVDRVVSSYTGAKQWYNTGEVTDGSASIRLELFRHGIVSFLASPLIGASEETLAISMIEAADRGELDPRALQFDSYHNENIIRAAKGGVIGLAVSLSTFIVPFIVFRRLGRSHNPEVRSLTQLGMIIPICFMIFGLTGPIWESSPHRFSYVALIVMLLAFSAAADSGPANLDCDVDHQ